MRELSLIVSITVIYFSGIATGMMMDKNLKVTDSFGNHQLYEMDHQLDIIANTKELRTAYLGLTVKASHDQFRDFAIAEQVKVAASDHTMDEFMIARTPTEEEINQSIQKKFPGQVGKIKFYYELDRKGMPK